MKQPKAVRAWACVDRAGNIDDVFFKPQSPERFIPVHIIRSEDVEKAISFMKVQNAGSLHRGTSVHILTLLGIKLPKPKAAPYCRTCKDLGLVNSGVPSMPMPCPKCVVRPLPCRHVWKYSGGAMVCGKCGAEKAGHWTAEKAKKRSKR